MSPRQRRYLHAEVIPAFAYGIDRLLDAADRPLVLWSNKRMKDMLKVGFQIESTEALSDAQAADFITEIQAFAAGVMIFISTPEEWDRGVSEIERERHYAMVLEPDPFQLQEAA